MLPFALAGNTSVKVFGPYGPIGLLGNGYRLKNESALRDVGKTRSPFVVERPISPLLNSPRWAMVGTAKCDSLLAFLFCRSNDVKKYVLPFTMGPPNTKPYCARV